MDTAANLLPPLLGDGKGVYRIHVIGNSATRLALILKIPFIPLDEVFWNPNWVQTPNDEFQARIDVLLEQHRETGWVIDGNYTRRMGAAVSIERTDCIWLDPPILLYLPRLIFRTFLRLISINPQCAPGCNETLLSVLKFNDESIIWWCITHHGHCREYGERLIKEDGGVGNGGKVRRIGGWGSELWRWTAEVERMAAEATG
ncbi:hypothetical protein H072_10860 [Dactylellina haptotyla CBS 200.50]|uniref:Uncharacterized protein n=1 Tax=Dactylellina haptotyla (strain CBS 200.50) TaxID=1284197 RepID=S8BKC2_DACHA|nr:hypothetical protein H072_10860 [Dactylellina haptotyla CBS 200.50]